MKRFLPKTWVGWFITGLLLVAIAFATFVIISVYSLYVVFTPTTTSFTSPFGNQIFSVSESCFSIACAQTTQLKISSETEATRSLTCNLHSRWDGIHFHNAIVEWNEDEQTIYWKLSGRDSFNEIDIENDCQ